MNPNDPHPAEQWKKVPDRILLASERLVKVQIEHENAFDLIERYKRPDVLIYADPPYLLATRKNKRMYKHEMTKEQHIQLLEMLDEHPGPVLLSGYGHPIYDNRLKHWRRETKTVNAEGGVSRTEVLWINPIATKMSSAAEKQLKLF
jgi:DNA adenine methylase